ncbi:MULTISPECIES: hypothetical protein [Burkholderia cepacia complex]|uniref:Uncharacterized protein n=1 Tax=Burkholderia pseudomultivorans TaxID=1207504 RepID=A0A6P2RIX3_9BURK|nr:MULTISPECIES: hypothetical protein [Burkholderia cepacia complex]MCA8142952.1 hypothetical protein [Burkholderia multivorans]KVW86812.1 hypothetical protein WL00_16305 [Burkholderia cepacia]KVX60905.1 hypothetical protein WL07_37665 [Burkholderia cepacia]MBO1859120.1 hypothetical protein [Burkholderia cenocepacia]MDR5645718.1 hypothetical protein [Burkholderia cenocepacia]
MLFDIDTNLREAVSPSSVDLPANTLDTITSTCLRDAGFGERQEATGDGELAFCEATLRQLGYVNIFSFATGEFMVVARNGERFRGNSLGDVLREMSIQLALTSR